MSEERMMIRVQVELTGLAQVRQRRWIDVPAEATLNQMIGKARATACNYIWDYEGVQDETVECVIKEIQN